MTAHHAYALFVQLISTAADGTTLVLHSVQTLLIWANLNERYRGRKLITANDYLIDLIACLIALITSSVSCNLKVFVKYSTDSALRNLPEMQ